MLGYFCIFFWFDVKQSCQSDLFFLKLDQIVYLSHIAPREPVAKRPTPRLVIEVDESSSSSESSSESSRTASQKIKLGKK